MFQAGLLGLLRVYKFGVSPFLPSACRFYPTCSEYMRESIERFGSGKGAWLGLKDWAAAIHFRRGHRPRSA